MSAKMDALEQSRNYFRLVRLTMIEGTNALRRLVLQRLPGGQTLPMVLHQKHAKLKKLNDRGIVTRHEWSVLYPETGNVDMTKIDMTLWTKLARNLIQIPRGLKIPWNDDDHPVMPGQEEWYDDIARIRTTRNNLFHLAKPELETETFQDLWEYISGAIRRLNPTVDLEQYKTVELNKEECREFERQVREQFLNERSDSLAAQLHRTRRWLRVVVIIAVVLIILALAAGAGTAVAMHVLQITCDRYEVFRMAGDFGQINCIPRSGWGARSPRSPLDPLRTPAPYVIYTHTAEVLQCKIPQECCYDVQNIQNLHMDIKKWDDIAFHFLIGGEGLIFDGRPTDKKPAAVSGWNDKIISIALIGNFQMEIPAPAALANFEMLLRYLLINNVVTTNFTLYAMCEVRNNTDSPGRNLYDKINHLGGEYPLIYSHRRYLDTGTCWFNKTTMGFSQYGDNY